MGEVLVDVVFLVEYFVDRGVDGGCVGFEFEFVVDVVY